MTTQDKKELNIEEVSSVTGGNANVPDEPIEIKTGPLMPGPTQKPDLINAQLKQ